MLCADYNHPQHCGRNCKVHSTWIGTSHSAARLRVSVDDTERRIHAVCRSHQQLQANRLRKASYTGDLSILSKRLLSRSNKTLVI